jgi:hypothetical protein
MFQMMTTSSGRQPQFFSQNGRRRQIGEDSEENSSVALLSPACFFEEYQVYLI